MDWSQLTYLAPVGAVLTAALIVVFLDLIIRKEDRYVLPLAALTGCAAGIVLVFQTPVSMWESTPWFLNFTSAKAGSPALILGGAFCVDRFGLMIWVLACAAGGLSVLCATRDSEESALTSGEYYGLTLLAVSGMMLLAVSHDFLTLLLSLEIMSISTYILAGSYRSNPESNEAAIKYLVLGGFSTAFMLMGIAFYYGGLGSISLAPNAGLEQLMRTNPLEGSNRQLFVILGMGLIFVGAMFKIGAAPFHFWIPDVYQGSPTGITALMAVGVKAGAFAIVARLAFETFGVRDYRGSWLPILTVAAVATMIVGNILAMRQRNVKRMLAYSGIAHTGYLMLALLVKPHSGDTAAMTEHTQAIVFYLFSYGIMTLGAFGVLSLIRQNGEPLEEMESFEGLAKQQPGIALCMAIFMLSLAGMPPMGGFFAKFLIFRGAISEGHVTAAVIGILTSVASLYYYLRVVVAMYMSPVVDHDEEAPAELPPISYIWSSNLLIYAAGIATIILGVVPGWFY